MMIIVVMLISEIFASRLFLLKIMLLNYENHYVDLTSGAM